MLNEMDVWETLFPLGSVRISIENPTVFVKLKAIKDENVDNDANRLRARQDKEELAREIQKEKERQEFHERQKKLQEEAKAAQLKLFIWKIFEAAVFALIIIFHILLQSQQSNFDGIEPAVSVLSENILSTQLISVFF